MVRVLDDGRHLIFVRVSEVLIRERGSGESIEPESIALHHEADEEMRVV